jgi:hypothetical protein
MRVGTVPKSWAAAASGCVLLALLAVLGGTVLDARSHPGPVIDHVADVLRAGGFTCSDGQFWSIPPKGQSTLNCDRFEIDAFNNRAEVNRFVGWKVKPQDARVLRRAGVDSFIVKGSRWLLFTPSAQIAEELRSRAGGRLLTVSR